MKRRSGINAATLASRRRARRVVRTKIAEPVPRANWFVRQFNANPRIWSLRVAVLVALVAVLTLHPASAGYFDDATNTFKGTTAGWMDNALNYMDELFALVMGTFVVIVVAKTGFQAIAGEAVTFATVLYPLAEMISFLVGPLVVTKIIARGALPNLTAAALTLSGIVAPGTHITNPDGIFDVGLGWANTFLATTSVPLAEAMSKNPTLNPIIGAFTMHDFVLGLIMALLGFIVYAILLAVFAIVAVELVARYLEIYIVVAVGAIKLGLLGSRATSTMATGVQNQAIGAVFGLIVIFLFATLVNTFIVGWTIAANVSDPEKFVRASGQVFAGAIAILFTCLRLSKAADKAGEGSAAFGNAGAEIVGGGVGAATGALASGARAVIAKRL